MRRQEVHLQVYVTAELECYVTVGLEDSVTGKREDNVTMIWQVPGGGSGEAQTTLLDRAPSRSPPCAAADCAPV